MAAPGEPHLASIPSGLSPTDASRAVLDADNNAFAATTAAPRAAGWNASRLPKPQQACTPAHPSAGKGGDAPAVLGIANLLAKYPKHSRRLLELDANADGVLDEEEVEVALRDLVEAEAQNRMLKWIVLGLSVLSVLLVFATVGVAVAAAVVSKDTKVTTTSLLVDKDTGFAVAVGPCAVRSLPTSKAIEAATATSGTHRRQRSLMASSSVAVDGQDSNVFVADGTNPEAGAHSVGRQLQSTASAYGWVNGYVTDDNYALDSAWLASNGLSSYSRVLVVGSDTSMATINALVAEVGQWCPNLSGVTPSTADPYGFFLTTFYCKIVKTSQAELTGVPTSFTCGCRLAIARTTCPETSDPAHKVDLTCGQDTTFFLDATASANCQVLSYRCPPTVAAVDSLIATGKAVFGDPGWTTTSGGSIEESISTIDLVSQSESRRHLLNSEGGAAGARRLAQWDTDPGSIVLVMTTTNTQSTWGR